MSNLLFTFPNVSALTCLTCVNRQRHECGGSVIQYCGVRSSNRTQNGLLKIKCKTPACDKYLQTKKTLNNSL